jgi:hypothetical protein
MTLHQILAKPTAGPLTEADKREEDFEMYHWSCANKGEWRRRWNSELYR